jgi:hypothetical protein
MDRNLLYDNAAVAGLSVVLSEKHCTALHKYSGTTSSLAVKYCFSAQNVDSIGSMVEMSY